MEVTMRKRVRLDEPEKPRKRVRLGDDTEPPPVTAPPPRPRRVRLDEPPTVMTTYVSGEHKRRFPAFTGDRARECEMCGHMYWRPCDGKLEDCPNRIFQLTYPKTKKRQR